MYKEINMINAEVADTEHAEVIKFTTYSNLKSNFK